MAIDIVSSIKGALYLSIKLTIIIVILTIIYEIYEHSKLYELTKKMADKPLNRIGISTNASITMIVGLFLGITYGAGILIRNAAEGNMSYKDIILSALFLSVCHAVIEDTLIFVAVGANGIVMLATRIVLALVIILSLNGFWSKNQINKENR